MRPSDPLSPLRRLRWPAFATITHLKMIKRRRAGRFAVQGELRTAIRLL
jgi:hypothetical protein|tara:strand:- start:13826 stop:13972 length:147 start_codon:yes stop_codon:yes gene_type:complete